ncbi:RNA-directed DNA polymerase, eukaryota [Tanacetum coccineum]
MRFMKHVGVASWFSQLCKAQPDFVSKERIVWIDIEGVPLHAWSRPTFSKIGSRWGEVIELEDNKEDSFALDDYSEDDSVNGAEEINGDISKQMNLDDETDIEGVSDTVFDDKADSLGHEHTQNLSPNEKENSSDPFNLYNLLNKRDKGEANSGLDSSIPFPPGFTPEREFQHVDAQEGQGEIKKLVVSIYGPQFVTSKRSLMELQLPLISRWDGHCMVMGDFNEVRCMEDRLGSVYNEQWFFLLLIGPLDQRPSLLREVVTDYEPSAFRVLPLLFSLTGLRSNSVGKLNQSGSLVDLRSKLCHIDKVIDQGGVNDDILLTRFYYLWLLTLENPFNASGGVVGGNSSDSSGMGRYDWKIPRTCSSVADWLRISSGSSSLNNLVETECDLDVRNSCSSRRKPPRKDVILMRLFRALSLGAFLDVIALLVGIVGCNTPI